MPLLNKPRLIPPPSASSAIIGRFINPLDCLTAHLMLECSEVFAGIKPANLVSLVNRPRPCGRNLYQLWQSSHQLAETRLSNINFLVLKTKERSLLLLCYKREVLEHHLSNTGVRCLLQEAGYDTTASFDSLLEELCQKIDEHNPFPHEIGLFIGYPAKDVAAFMGINSLPFTCQGPWKMFGDPTQSLELAKQYRCCRQKMSSVLASGHHTALKLHDPQHPFFCHTIDIDIQYLVGDAP